jgi:hypothetical protein
VIAGNGEATFEFQVEVGEISAESVAVNVVESEVEVEGQAGGERAGEGPVAVALDDAVEVAGGLAGTRKIAVT